MDLRLNLFRKMFQSLMVTTVKLISLPLQLTTPSLNLKCLKHNLQIHNFLDFLLLNADGNENEMKLLGCDLHCGHWCMITLILKALANRNVPSTMNRSTSPWSSSQMAVKAQPTFQLDGTMTRKPMRSTLVPQQIFGASKMDFWLETCLVKGLHFPYNRFSLVCREAPDHKWPDNETQQPHHPGQRGAACPRG